MRKENTSKGNSIQNKNHANTGVGKFEAATGMVGSTRITYNALIGK